MNAIELITKYSRKAWDKVYKMESMSSLLDVPNGLFEFTGAKTVRIAKYTAGGLSDYYRNNAVTGADPEGKRIGYAASDLSLVWETFTLEKDRAAKFNIELMDNEETDGLAIGATTSEVSRTVMVPEVDAYCFAKISSYCSAALGNLVPGSVVDNKALAPLNDAFLYFDNHEVPAENQIIFVSPTYLNGLRTTQEMTRMLGLGDWDKNVSFRMTEYEGRKLVVVPPQRFNTQVELYAGGYRCTGTPIDFLVVAKDAVTHIVKYEKLKVIGGDMNLAGNNFDGYTVYARIYHDVFVPDNKRFAIYCHTGAYTYSGVATGAKTLTVDITTGNKIKAINLFPADVYAAGFVTSASTVAPGAAVTINESVKVKVGDVLAANKYVVAYDSYGKCIACTAAVVVSQ